MRYFVILEVQGDFPGGRESTKFAVPEQMYDFLWNSLIEKARQEQKADQELQP